MMGAIDRKACRMDDTEATTEATTEDVRAIAERAAEAVRELIHATQAAKGRLAYPADVYDVLGSLEVMAGRLPQTYRQLANWLDQQAEAQRIQAPDGLFTGDVPAAVATATHWLQEAGTLAEQMRLALENALVAVGGLAYAGHDEPPAQSAAT
jgi:hypothetical protein